MRPELSPSATEEEPSALSLAQPTRPPAMLDFTLSVRGGCFLGQEDHEYLRVDFVPSGDG